MTPGIVACCALAAAGRFTDPTDGGFDLSEWLLDRKGFLPVPIIITEPAVGNGGGLAVLFFRESIREAAGHSREGGHVTPPDIFGAAAFATENGSKGVGAGGMMSFRDDRWRYRGGVAKVDVNLDFYGPQDRGTGGGSSEAKVGFSLVGVASSQQALLRLGASDEFLALRWIYMDLESSFDPAQPRPNLPDTSFAQRNSGLGVSWEHDSRDNIFTPSRGWMAGVDTLFYGPGIGGDKTFQTYRAHVFAYWPALETLVVGGRLDARAARGDVPFYQKPFVELRGIPAMRYQDDNTAVAEVEARWNVTPRWAAIGFLGAGRAWGTDESFRDAGSRVSKGIGIRYLVARRLGMYVGIDYARGPEQGVYYLQVGSAWR